MPAAGTTASRYIGGGPYDHAFTITPNDSNELTFVTQGLFVNGAAAGTIAVIMSGGEAATFNYASGPSWLPIRVRLVKATGTSGSPTLIGLY